LCRFLSSDGKWFAYEVFGIGSKKSLIVAGAREGKPYDYVSGDRLSFLPNGAVAYVARDGARFVRVTQSVQ
jgi:hypothetical protein